MLRYRHTPYFRKTPTAFSAHAVQSVLHVSTVNVLALLTPHLLLSALRFQP